VPVVIKGLRKNGRAYQRTDLLPIEKTSLQMQNVLLDESMPEAQRAESIKAMLAAQIPPDGLLMEISGE
jgi:hypothetical protein